MTKSDTYNLLIEGATALEAWDVNVHWDYSVFGSIHPECGTSACAAGYLAIKGACGLEAEWVNKHALVFKDNHGIDNFQFLAHKFGISHNEATWLFCNVGYADIHGDELEPDLRFKARPEDVAKAMRQLANERYAS